MSRHDVIFFPFFFAVDRSVFKQASGEGGGGGGGGAEGRKQR